MGLLALHLSLLIRGSSAHPCRVADLASKNTECSVKLEFQINNEELFSMSYAIFGMHLYKKKKSIVYLRLKSN